MHGIEQRHFTLFLQPQIDMQSNEVIGAEALLRWQQYDGSYTLPADVIPLAEELGVIVPLGNWVLEESCRILADWQQRGIELPLAVNVSGIQMQDEAFVPHLKNLLAQYRIDPRKLLLRSPRRYASTISTVRWRCCVSCTIWDCRSRWTTSAWATPAWST